MGFADAIENYKGSFYGVEASVELNMNTRVATVSLKGAVLGGKVEGKGWLNDSGKEEGGVVLERQFEARLRRRFVKIEGAALDRTNRVVIVAAIIPIFGRVKIVLNQDE